MKWPPVSYLRVLTSKVNLGGQKLLGEIGPWSNEIWVFIVGLQTLYTGQGSTFSRQQSLQIFCSIPHWVQLTVRSLPACILQQVSPSTASFWFWRWTGEDAQSENNTTLCCESPQALKSSSECTDVKPPFFIKNGCPSHMRGRVAQQLFLFQPMIWRRLSSSLFIRLNMRDVTVDLKRKMNDLMNHGLL